MTFSTIMVHLELEPSNDARLRIAGDLAERFDTRVIGIAAADAQPRIYAGSAFARNLVATIQSEIETQLEQAEARFRLAMKDRARDIEWRSALARPTEYVVHESRAADLIITGANRDGPLLDQLRYLNPSDLVMRAGRPIFVVPPEAEYLNLQNVLVAWKDTREARRAVLDALPLLQKAKEVNVLEVIDREASRTAAQRRVNDVAAWLARHNILAFPKVTHAANETDQIDHIWQSGADVVVAGAYGHSRFGEWVFGGITENLITRSRHCSFLTH